MEKTSTFVGRKRGYKCTKETKIKISNGLKGSKNGMWKGDGVGYGSLHDYIKCYLPNPKICFNCKTKGVVELCNISGLYKREINDWKWLCRKCHMEEDGRLRKFKNISKNRDYNIVKRDKKGRFI